MTASWAITSQTFMKKNNKKNSKTNNVWLVYICQAVQLFKKHLTGLK